MDEAYEQELERADQALRRNDFETAFGHLERAHVLAQRMTGRHTFVHGRMLVAEPCDWRGPGPETVRCGGVTGVDGGGAEDGHHGKDEGRVS